MFESKAAMFLYCVSPVHMGAGTAIGAIDNPIQRERHTGHPCIAGSGLKGAMRHEANALWKEKGLVSRIFGPDPETENASDHAGALSIADAQIVLFPVRSLRRSYVYATCPTAIARLQRLLALAEVRVSSWTIPNVSRDGCVLINGDLKSGDKLVLEAYAFAPEVSADGLQPVAQWLSDNALPDSDANDYFRKKVKDDTVVLSDDRFNYFVRNATIVEPHVRIDDATGTAADTGLFYTENLPPESLLVSLAMASKERAADGKNGGTMQASQILQKVKDGPQGATGFDNRLIQVGGDSTTGRGQVLLKFAALETNGEAKNA